MLIGQLTERTLRTERLPRSVRHFSFQSLQAAVDFIRIFKNNHVTIHNRRGKMEKFDKPVQAAILKGETHLDGRGQVGKMMEKFDRNIDFELIMDLRKKSICKKCEVLPMPNVKMILCGSCTQLLCQNCCGVHCKLTITSNSKFQLWQKSMPFGLLPSLSI